MVSNMVSFEEGSMRLSEAVGSGKLEGSVAFEQFCPTQSMFDPAYTKS